MKTLTLILSLTLGLALTAWADPGDRDGAPGSEAFSFGQPSWQAKPLLQLAQGATEEDECLGKCEQELNKCRESGKAESECGEALNACQQACEVQG
jgi:hypothetical protein